MKKIVLLLTLLFPLMALSAEYSAGTTLKNLKVTKVADGDTLEVLKEKERIKIRIWGIDAPEKSQDFGRASQEFLKELLNGNNGTVDIKVKGYDQYKRMIATVYVGKKDVAGALVANGYAWSYTKYDKMGYYKPLEAIAKELKRGLWSNPTRIPPWEFRKEKKEKAQGADVIKFLYQLGR